MRKSFIALALAAAFVGGWAPPAGAQDNGIVIQNNGVSNSDSAAGADNVRISRADGNSSSNNGAGANNAVMRAEKEPKDRSRKDRGEKSNDEMAPADAPAEAAPAEGEYEAYGEETGWVEPAAAPEAAPQEMAQPVDQSAAPIQLPNTGSGLSGTLPLAALLAAVASVVLGAGSARRRSLG